MRFKLTVAVLLLLTTTQAHAIAPNLSKSERMLLMDKEELVEYAEKLGTHPTEVYFFYTTCPKCAKHYGKNYTIGFAKLG